MINLNDNGSKLSNTTTTHDSLRLPSTISKESTLIKYVCTYARTVQHQDVIEPHRLVKKGQLAWNKQMRTMTCLKCWLARLMKWKIITDSRWIIHEGLVHFINEKGINKSGYNMVTNVPYLFNKLNNFIQIWLSNWWLPNFWLALPYYHCQNHSWTWLQQVTTDRSPI